MEERTSQSKSSSSIKLFVGQIPKTMTETELGTHPPLLIFSSVTSFPQCQFSLPTAIYLNWALFGTQLRPFQYFVDSHSWPISHKATGLHRGCAFVTYTTREEADTAIQVRTNTIGHCSVISVIYCRTCTTGKPCHLYVSQTPIILPYFHYTLAFPSHASKIRWWRTEEGYDW